MSQIRVYEHVGQQLTESVTVHLSDDGYVRMTVDNLHDLLGHLGFVQIKTKEKVR